MRKIPWRQIYFSFPVNVPQNLLKIHDRHGFYDITRPKLLPIINRHRQ